MSTISCIPKRCAVCGSESDYIVICSTNSFGSPDLDLRPPEMKRSTMCYWPEECSTCGYVAHDIEAPSQAEKGWLSSDEYISCAGHVFQSALEGKFSKIYLLAKRQHNSQDAFNALRNAAWACDDIRDNMNATLRRRLLLPWLEKELKRGSEATETLALVKADVPRRAGLFDQVISEYSGCIFSAKILTKIAAFQVHKAREQDCACYTVDAII